MEKLNPHEVFMMLIQLSLLLLVARTFGELFKKIGQPAVVGELFGGILLGPTLFQKLSPHLCNELFIAYPKATIAMNGIYSISVIMLLFVAGMEIELPLIWKNGRSALFISSLGVILPFAVGWACGRYFYELFDPPAGSDKPLFAIFMGTALSITALPVIAKILLDLNLLNSKVGGIIIACAMLDDFIGWLLFSVVLSLMPHAAGGSDHLPVWQTALLTIGFALVVLTGFRFLLNHGLRFLTKKSVGAGGLLTIAMIMCFLGAITTEAIGIHAVFGAFLMGVAFGESNYFSEKSKEIIHQFITNIFAPLFFVSVGLKVDFIKSFDWQVTGLVLVIAFVSKIIGGYFGGRAGGLRHNESLAIGFGINARGAMEIILGLVALQAGLINDVIFVALTIMAIITSSTSGYFIKLFVKRDELA